MPVVEKEYFEPDQVPTAAELNAAYDALAVASAFVAISLSSVLPAGVPVLLTALLAVGFWLFGMRGGKK
jgi:hypothetical protein